MRVLVARRVRGVKRAALLVFLASLALRFAWVQGEGDSPFDNVFSDMAGYIHRARQLAYGAAAYAPGEAHPRLAWEDPWSYLSTFYAPGAHFVYAAQMRLVGWTQHRPFELIHCLWGAVVAPCAMLLALRVVPRLPVAVFVGLGVAVWDPLLSFTSFFSSEQPYAALLALSAWLLVRLVEGKRGAVALGLAVGLAYLVRPQIILTMGVLGLVWLQELAHHGTRVRPRIVPLLVAGVLVAGSVGFAAERYHRLSGRWGLVCDDEGMARIFADTPYARVRAITHAPDGTATASYFFEPPSKVVSGDHDEYDFDGYIGDPDMLARGRRAAVARMTASERVTRWISNVSLLFVRNDLWPEQTHLVPDRPWRIGYAQLCKGVLLGLLLPLAFVGMSVSLLRPTPVRVVCTAHLATSLVTAAFFYGEARYRVPYDTFIILLALVGASVVAPWMARWLAPPPPT